MSDTEKKSEGGVLETAVNMVKGAAEKVFEVVESAAGSAKDTLLGITSEHVDKKESKEKNRERKEETTSNEDQIDIQIHPQSEEKQQEPNEEFLKSKESGKHVPVPAGIY
jgi:hypothetical protein